MLISAGTSKAAKGQIVHQAFKKMEGENCLINTLSVPMTEDDDLWDPEKPNQVAAIVFETYSFDSCNTHELRYNEEEFDELFRFNAELMNPNHRAGRYHWVGQRLYFAPDADGKNGRALRCSEVGPTPDECHLLKGSNVEIPASRGGTYEERQALRDSMDYLEKKRDGAIREKKNGSHKKFCDKVASEQAIQAEFKKDRMDRIDEEKAHRTERLQRETELLEHDASVKAALERNRGRTDDQKTINRKVVLEENLNARVTEWKEQDRLQFASLEEARALAREAHAQEMLQQEKDRADMLALEKKRDKYLVGFEQKQLARRVDQKNVIEKKTTERNREAQALHETKQDILRNERVTVEKRVHKFQDLLVKVEGMFKERPTLSEQILNEKKPQRSKTSQSMRSAGNDVGDNEVTETIEDIGDDTLLGDMGEMSAKEIARRRAHEIYNAQGESKRKTVELNQSRAANYAAKDQARRERVAARRKDDLLVQNDKKNAMDKEKMERIARRRAQKTSEQRQVEAKKQETQNMNNMRSRRIAKKQARAASPQRAAAPHQ